MAIGVQNPRGESVPGALVRGRFSVGGSWATCTTQDDGRCEVTSGSIARRTRTTTFTISDIAGSGMTYDPARNAVSEITVDRRGDD